MQTKYLIAPLLVATATNASASFLKAGVALGEHGNKEDTTYHYLETSYDVGPRYSIEALLEENDHPAEHVDGFHLYGGGSYHITDHLHLRALLSDDVYKGIATARVNDGDITIEASIYYQNSFSNDKSITGLKTQAGYMVTSHYEIGASYEVRNVEKDKIDDMLGGYLTYHW